MPEKTAISEAYEVTSAKRDCFFAKPRRAVGRLLRTRAMSFHTTSHASDGAMAQPRRNGTTTVGSGGFANRRARSTDQFIVPIDRRRAADVIALYFVAGLLGQERELLMGLHAFGYDRQVEPAG